MKTVPDNDLSSEIKSMMNNAIFIEYDLEKQETTISFPPGMRECTLSEGQVKNLIEVLSNHLPNDMFKFLIFLKVSLCLLLFVPAFACLYIGKIEMAIVFWFSFLCFSGFCIFYND